MKKHRNFLILYSLWLAVIFALFAIFDTPQEIKLPQTNKNTICKVSSGVTNHEESNKGFNKRYCVSIEGHTTSKLQ